MVVSVRCVGPSPSYRCMSGVCVVLYFDLARSCRALLRFVVTIDFLTPDHRVNCQTPWFSFYVKREPSPATRSLIKNQSQQQTAMSRCTFYSGKQLYSDQGSAIVLVGRKGTTNCYYCGDPVDDSECTVDEGDWAVDCHLSVQACGYARGYHCGPFELQILLYDTEEISSAALNEQDAWTVLPYEIWHPSSEFFKPTDSCANPGGIAFDDVMGRVYVVERDLGNPGDNAAAVHVWSVPSWRWLGKNGSHCSGIALCWFCNSQIVLQSNNWVLSAVPRIFIINW